MAHLISAVRRPLRWLVSAVALVAVALAVVATGFHFGLGSGPVAEKTNGSTDTHRLQQAPAGSLGEVAAARDSLSAAITAAQQRLKRLPRDYETWGELGLAYVQQAKNTINPLYYPKAEGALKQSLAINTRDNFVAMTGMASLESARHNFASALSWAKRATTVNPYSAAAWGIESDALLQLGRYQEAFEAIQKENDLQPGTPAFARASYAFELRGDIDGARATMQRALDAAATPPDRAFAHYYLGELDFNAGDPKGALAQYSAGLKADPSYTALLEGRAKAEWANGDSHGALRDFADVVGRVPDPSYVLEYGELLESLGKTAEAQRQYDLFTTEGKLFQSNGVTLDLDPILFYANHGDPKTAVTVALAGVKQRPFLEVQDALAWALYQDGKYAEALEAERKAMVLGTRNALFYAHAGLIEQKLGQTTAAKRDLAAALKINPWFHPLQAPLVRRALRQLGGEA